MQGNQPYLSNNFALKGSSMYKKQTAYQVSFFDFNQACGMQLNKNNEWIHLSTCIDWDRLEEIYAENFPSHTGRPAKPLRMALGALIIQKRMNLSDRALVEQIAQNPYFQYFIGLKKFETACPFSSTSLVGFRERFDVDFLRRANEMFLENAAPTPEHRQQLDAPDKQVSEQTNLQDAPNSQHVLDLQDASDPQGDQQSDPKDAQDTQNPQMQSSDTNNNANLGTFILDATCSPSNIKYPQDFCLLNDARQKLEEMIDWFCATYPVGPKPRTYRKVMQKQYLTIAKTRRRSTKTMRSHIRKQLGCLNRNMRYIDGFITQGFELDKKYVDTYETIKVLYDQQKYMFDNHTHRVEDRIVSISQPYIRPIVRGKAKAKVEFGAKYDVSIDELGHARLEKIQFDAYNESTVLIEAVERYKARCGHYPARVLVDQIYRTRKNRAYCKEHNIRMSGPALGRPAKDAKEQNMQAQIDNTDRIEVERFFSREKRCAGAGLIMTKLEQTTLASIALSVFVANIFATEAPSFFCLFFAESANGITSYHFIDFEDVA
jgi:transposase, IS5 family